MKFSIRDLLLVTAIVALVVGWSIDRGRLATKLKLLTPSTSNPTPAPPAKAAKTALKSI